jgi:glycerate kinase
MKIICAPDSFKETLSATAAANAMARGARRAAGQWNRDIEIDACPVGDGGEGTMDALAGSMGGAFRKAEALDPLGKPMSARYAVVKQSQSHIFENVRLSPGATRIGIVELAEVSGLARVPPPQRDPTRATSFGTGQLIRRTIDDGCAEVIVCIGGSATVDGGAGIAQALGAKFFDAAGHLIHEPICGGMLKRIARVEPPPPVPRIRVACDVTNPLYGSNGAALWYGPQKGATPEQARELDDALAHFASIIGGEPDAPGAGAAGGAGFGLATLCNATLERGINLVLRAVEFDRRCTGASLVLTGEGRLDRQSLHGKACMGVAVAAAEYGVPTVAIVGSSGEDADKCLTSNGGFLQRYFNLAEHYGMEMALRETERLIESATVQTLRDLHSHLID